MDNDKAIAEAIAALDEIIAEHDRPVRPMMYDAEQHPFGITMKIPSDEQIASMELWTRARTTLASLRAVAPASAELSTIERCKAIVRNYIDESERHSEPNIRISPDYEDRKKIDCNFMAREIIASFDALASTPADQGDAGRDGVIEQCAAKADQEAVRLGQMRDASIFDADKRMFEAKSCTATVIALAIRTLASAPSEAVERPEDWIAELTKVVKYLDEGIAWNDGSLPSAILTEQFDKFALEHRHVILKALAFPTADRDALKAVIDGTTWGHEATTKLMQRVIEARNECAAALGLLGEG